MDVDRLRRGTLRAAFPVVVTVVLVWAERPVAQVDPAQAVGNVLVGACFALTAVFLSNRDHQRGNVILFAAVATSFAIDQTSWRTAGHVAGLTAVAVLIGCYVQPLAAAVLLRYPETTFDRPGRVFVGVNLALATMIGLWQAVAYDPASHRTKLALSDNHAFDVAQGVRSDWWLAAGVVFLVLLARRWHGLGALERRTLAPILATAVVVTVAIAAKSAEAWLSPPAVEVLVLARSYGAAAVSVAFLISALRFRLARATIADLAASLEGPVDIATLQTELRAALTEPTLEIHYWVPERHAYVDSSGAEVVRPRPPDRLTVDVRTNNGEPLAILETDPLLQRHAALLESAVAVSRLALQNGRLEAELRAQLDATQKARARLLHSGLEQRRQLERDLHDGAQQRLLAVGMRLVAIEAAARDPEAVDAVLVARKELGRAMDDLRDLAHGIYPAVLSQSGLTVALESVVERLPCIVHADVHDGRWHGDIESAAYLTACEALTNAVKHAAPCTVWLTVQPHRSDLLVSVRDDGPGCPDLNDRDSLPALRDRLDALGGTVEVKSSPSGTLVEARIPCA